MKSELSRVPAEHKVEFYESLFSMNANRMIILFLALAATEAILFIEEAFFEPNSEGIQKILVIKVVFVVMSLLFAAALWLLKKNKRFKLLGIIVVLGVFASILLAITNTLAAQKMVSDISIYIMMLYIATAIIRLPYVWYMVIYSLCFTYFAVGMQTAQANIQFVKWAIINAFILSIIATIIARILYSQHVEIFLDKNKINHQLETLKYMAEHDGLTNLYNHQTISIIIENQKELSRNFKDELCIAVMDIDNFKTINDRYGHIAGDQVLKDIAKRIKENVRKNDFVARYGGDEFVILFPDITAAQANKICERILDSIHHAGPDNVNITSSIGLTALTENNFHDFIEKADMNMYKAKNTGKAQIIM